jgi:uncharacterized protein YqjF (DUF2071 family)
MAAVALVRSCIEPAPTAPPHARPFLAATWRDFLMLSYDIEPRVLAPFVPAGTELDLWRGKAYLSLVGFCFCDAQLLGMRVPGHGEFAEVNLRFYVRRRVEGRWRRGVVFLRELCPKRAVVAVARWIYGERFRRVPLACRIERALHDSRDDDLFGPDCRPPGRMEFAWRDRGQDFRLAATVDESARRPEPDSLAEFVVDHYWAYTLRPRRTLEYLAPHAPWRIAAAQAEFFGDAWVQYGPRFAPYLRGEPACAFWASGSSVRIYRGERLR